MLCGPAASAFLHSPSLSEAKRKWQQLGWILLPILAKASLSSSNSSGGITCAAMTKPCGLELKHWKDKMCINNIEKEALQRWAAEQRWGNFKDGSLDLLSTQTSHFCPTQTSWFCCTSCMTNKHFVLLPMVAIEDLGTSWSLRWTELLRGYERASSPSGSNHTNASKEALPLGFQVKSVNHIWYPTKQTKIWTHMLILCFILHFPNYVFMKI